MVEDVRAWLEERGCKVRRQAPSEHLIEKGFEAYGAGSNTSEPTRLVVVSRYGYTAPWGARLKIAVDSGQANTGDPRRRRSAVLKDEELREFIEYLLSEYVEICNVTEVEPELDIPEELY